MEVLGRLPRAAYRPVENLVAGKYELAAWRAGRIVTAAGRLVRVERRWLAYKATRLRVGWDRLRSERGRITPFAMSLRNFADLSAIFSFCVPRNKCSGLMHAGTSHRWQTDKPVGMGPYTAVQAARCAYIVRRLTPR